MFVAVASVILSTAVLIELYVVLLPSNPTVTKLSMKVGGAKDALVAFCAQLAVPVNDPTNDPVNDPVNGDVNDVNWVELLMTPSVFNSFFTPSRKCTDEVSNAIVPADVMVPPFNPSPAVTDVTVPAPPGAQLADIAQLLVPNNDPVNPWVTCSEPVTLTDPVTVNDPVMSSPSGKVTPPDT